MLYRLDLHLTNVGPSDCIEHRAYLTGPNVCHDGVLGVVRTNAYQVELAYLFFKRHLFHELVDKNTLVMFPD